MMIIWPGFSLCLHVKYCIPDIIGELSIAEKGEETRRLLRQGILRVLLLCFCSSNAETDPGCTFLPLQRIDYWRR